MTHLTTLPNIGPALALELEAIGVHTPVELGRMGALEASLRISRRGHYRGSPHAVLLSLEGAIRGIKWQRLPKPRREELTAAFDDAREIASP